jgi:N-acetyl-anhydromuramyl-L-alanine amidase AmpD
MLENASLEKKEKIEMPPPFNYNYHLVPVQPGHAVSKGWNHHVYQPVGVTWHWTATKTLESCRKVIGGENPSRKGQASAHFCVGKTFEEGIDVYVELENRSWHAGVNQALRWDGLEANGWTGSRTTIGIETVNVGFERPGFPAGENWVKVDSPNGKFKMKVPVWTNEQIQMMIHLGKKIQEKFPHIRPEDHHGHHDICPGYKEDPSLAFPFAKILSGIYDRSIEDVWSPFISVESRQQALVDLGYDLGDYGERGNGVDGDWGRTSDSALRDFQRRNDMVENGYWTTFVCREVYKQLRDKNNA